MSENKYPELKQFLRDRGQSISTFREECGLSTTYVSLILNGHTVPSIPTRKLIEMTLKKMFPQDKAYIEQMIREIWS